MVGIKVDEKVFGEESGRINIQWTCVFSIKINSYTHFLFLCVSDVDFLPRIHAAGVHTAISFTHRMNFTQLKMLRTVMQNCTHIHTHLTRLVFVRAPIDSVAWKYSSSFKNTDIEIPFFSAEIFKSFDMLTEQIVLRVAIAMPDILQWSQLSSVSIQSNPSCMASNDQHTPACLPVSLSFFHCCCCCWFYFIFFQLQSHFNVQ